MKLPPGYSLLEDPRVVCKLKKALYGLKQSLGAWFSKFTGAMVSFGYSQSCGDHTLFFKHNNFGLLLILVVYVDDIVVTRNDVDEIRSLEGKLSTTFDIKILGSLKYFLGIEIAYSEDGIFISQHKYVFDLLCETGKLDYQPATTPVDPHMKLDKADSSSPVEKISFQRLIGRLIYLNHSRPDISYVVNVLSQFMSDT